MKERNSKFYTAIIAVFVMTAFVFIGCEGPAGEDGADGAPGIDGKDGEEQCGVCHNAEDVIGEKQAEWSLSSKGSGGSYSYAGGISSCAPCHAEQAYDLWSETSFDEAKINITAPKQIGCYACHPIHETFSEEDLQLQNAGAFNLMGMLTNEAEVDLGKGNQCAKCHQARARDYDLGPQKTGDIEIGAHWGPHHGTQTNMVVAKGGVEFGSGYSANHTHSSVQDACVNCHAHEGNHTFSPAIEVCQECHSDAEDFEYRDFQSDIQTLLTQLEDNLIDEGVLAKEDGDEMGHPVEGVTTEKDKAGALYNYLLIAEDGSLGLHNPLYVETLLRNSIKVFE